MWLSLSLSLPLSVCSFEVVSYHPSQIAPHCRGFQQDMRKESTALCILRASQDETVISGRGLLLSEAEFLQA